MKQDIPVFLAIMILSLATFSAFAQTNELLSVKTSENSYEEGDTIVISGNVTAVILDTPVTLQIFHEGNLVDIAQITVAQDGKFTHTMLAEGPLWQKDGKYILRVSYGANYMVETNFEYNTKLSVIETTDIFEVDAGSYGTFDVHYTVRGATVKSMIVDPEVFALIVIVETQDDGSITLDLPRESIDAKNDSTDDSFIILIDGVEVPYKEIVTDVDSRTITIEFEQGDSDIEIIGTSVIPEFGSIATLILIVGIVSIILLSSKYRIQLQKPTNLNF
jgi:predicted secreted protein with PEFG-CTERM motif